MPIKFSNIRYQKLDSFCNFIFICDKENETKNYDKLVKYTSQLKEKFPDHYLPLYYNEEYKYASVRLKKDTKIQMLKLNPNDLVDLSFNIKKKKGKEGQIYVNCILEKIKLVKRAPPVDEGSDVDLDDVLGGHSVKT